MKLKKLMAIGLATAMTLSAMTACGRADTADTKEAESTAAVVEEVKEEAAPEKEEAAEATEEEKGITFPLEETMTFTGYANYMSTEAGKGDLNDSKAWQIVKERANIEIELTSVLANEREEKLGLVFASGDYPDMLIKCDLDAEEYGVKEGILIPLEDMIREYAPNLTAFLDENNYWPYITSSDGHVYTLPFEMTIQNPFQKYWINMKWIENLGLAEPTSYDELYTVLKAFKDEDANGNGDPNDEIPLSTCMEISPFMLLTYADYPIHINLKLGVKDNELVYVPMQDDYKEFLAYLAKLYGEGLLDSECFTQNISQQSSKGQSADVFGGFFRANPSATVGTHYEGFRILTPFQEGTYAKNDPVEDGTFAITDACENPEVLMAWVDYFYTEEGATLAYMGVEDISYKWNDNGLYTTLEVEGQSDSYNSMHGQTYYPAIVPEVLYKKDYSDDPLSELIDTENMRVAETGKSVTPLPPMLYTEDETKTISTIKADVDGYVNEYLAKVTVGEYDLEATWDEYIETLKAMRVEEMFAAYKAAYDRAME